MLGGHDEGHKKKLQLHKTTLKKENTEQYVFFTEIYSVF